MLYKNNKTATAGKQVARIRGSREVQPYVPKKETGTLSLWPLSATKKHLVPFQPLPLCPGALTPLLQKDLEQGCTDRQSFSFWFRNS